MQLHRISLYLAREGPPQSCPRPSLLCPWSPGSSAVSSPSPFPVQSQSSPVPSQTRRSAAPASTVDILHLNLHCAAPWKSHHPPDCCHLCCPPPPTHSPTSRPASKQPCPAVLSCRSATPAPRPHLLYRPGQLQITRTIRVQHGTPYRSARLQSTWSQRPSATRRPFDSRRGALIIRPSLFGLDPALPTRIPSSLDISPRRSLAPRAADLCLAIVPTIPPRPPPEPPVASTRPAAARPPVRHWCWCW